MSSYAFDRLVSSGWKFDRLVDVTGVPRLNTLGTVQEGVALTLTGTSFSASGNRVFVTQNGVDFEISVASEGTTSITTVALNCTYLFVTQPIDIWMQDASEVASNAITVAIADASGKKAHAVGQQFLGASASRLESDDGTGQDQLQLGDEIIVSNVQGGTVADINLTDQGAFDAASAVTAFDFAIQDGSGRGATATQTLASPASTATVPNVLGQAQATAQSNIVAAGLLAQVVASVPSTSTIGNVVDQFPDATEIVPLGSTVELTLSLGSGVALVPPLLGNSQTNALSLLAAAGLSGTVYRVIDGNNSGLVINQSIDPGEVVAIGTVILIAVSSNQMPGLVGELIQNATGLIQAAGLTLNPSMGEQYSSVFDLGEVISQLPIVDSVVSPGDVVTLTVSLGGFPVGTMLTAFLDDSTPVPATATYVSGHAFAQNGAQYVALWPADNAVFYDGPFAYRDDGALIIALGGVVVARPQGVALTYRGEVISAVSVPEIIHNGWAMLSNGVVCMSETS